MPPYVREIANTPAVGPSPTTLTKINAQTISGILRKNINNALTEYRNENAMTDFLFSNAETDKAFVIIKADGIPIIRAKNKPTVAIAIVCTELPSTSYKKSLERLGGKKVDKRKITKVKVEREICRAKIKGVS